MGFIRIFLALSVVVWHLWGHALPFTVNGYDSVLLFFIISGFYMSMVLNGKYLNSSIAKFYAARLLRIYPLYLIILIAAVGFWDAIGKPLLPVPSTTRELLFVTFINITTFGIPSVSDWNFVANGPAWTLGLELQFYLVAPFILTRKPWVCVLVLLGLIAWRLSLRDRGFDWLYTSAQANACFFMLGAVGHRIGTLIVDAPKRNILGWAAVAMLPIAGFFCGLPVVKHMDRPELWFFYLTFAAAMPFIFSISMSSRFDRFLGDLCFPIYIVHVPLIVVLTHFGGTIFRYLPSEFSRQIELMIIVLAATALHLIVERPIEKIRQRLSAPAKPIRRAPLAGGYEAAPAGAPAE
ncbi:MAG: acyltransferase [Hyphomicrobiales bacterium]|nr:acyltransferase [Hyphomicrobiales bacterium]